MTERNDGGPAFPRPTSTDETINPANIDYAEPGMSLRDWFAGQALIGAVTVFHGHGFSRHTVAKTAYAYADAMMEARGDAQ